MTVVSTCSPTNVSVSRDRLRCSETVTNLGHAGLANRTEVRMPKITVTVSSTRAVSPVARVANHSGLVAVATAAVVIVAAQEPPLTAWPPPVPGETPDEEEIPDEEDWPLLVAEPPVRPLGRCGSDGTRCENRAKTTAAAATASSPIRQVIFLTRRRPSSLARIAGVCCERVTRQEVSALALRIARKPLQDW